MISFEEFTRKATEAGATVVHDPKMFHNEFFAASFPSGFAVLYDEKNGSVIAPDDQWNDHLAAYPGLDLADLEAACRYAAGLDPEHPDIDQVVE